MYDLPTNDRRVDCEWSHNNPDTVLHYNTKMYVNGALFSQDTLPSGTYKDSSIVDQGKLLLKIEAVGICGHNATHEINDSDINCE